MNGWCGASSAPRFSAMLMASRSRSQNFVLIFDVHQDRPGIYIKLVRALIGTGTDLAHNIYISMGGDQDAFGVVRPRAPRLGAHQILGLCAPGGHPCELRLFGCPPPCFVSSHVHAHTLYRYIYKVFPSSRGCLEIGRFGNRGNIYMLQILYDSYSILRSSLSCFFLKRKTEMTGSNDFLMF